MPKRAFNERFGCFLRLEGVRPNWRNIGHIRREEHAKKWFARRLLNLPYHKAVATGGRVYAGEGRKFGSQINGRAEKICFCEHGDAAR